MGGKGGTGYIVLGGMALTFGLGRLFLGGEGDRSTGIYGVVIGLIGLAAGLIDRKIAQAAAQKRASLPAGDDTVVLLAAGPRVVEVIKELRQQLGLDLRTAKHLVDRPGSAVVRDVDRPTAEALVEGLQARGAEAEIVSQVARPEAMGDGLQ
jgi:large subunit ribosomal protein L7/L12